MSEEALYERYKSALRVGHVAAVRGRHDAALAAYAEAASLAPDRPLPHASMGRVLLRLDRIDEALEAYATALRLAPRDETSLTGRADALVAAGRPAEAAGVLDLLAETQQLAARLPDACDTARRALELAESRARRRTLETLVAELRTWPADRGGEEQLARALRTLETAPVRAASVEPAASPGPTAEPETADTELTETETETEALASSGAALVGLDIERAGPAGELAEPALDLGALSIAIEDAVETGDPLVVHKVVLAAVATMRRVGLLDAAIDACQLGLTVSPADPDLHLALAELDLDHGWLTAAADKLVILDRYVELTDNGPARTRLWALVDARIPDEPRLSALRT
jgi:tetratricopeptide (TPR) repeat protein